MKIRNDNPPLTGATDALVSAGDQAAAATAAQKPSSQADLITLSSEVRTLADRAAEPLGVRQDVVDRMRALLDKGAIGNDPARLADAIIDDWLSLPKAED